MFLRCAVSVACYAKGMRLPFVTSTLLALLGCSSPPLDPNCQLEEADDWGPAGTADFDVETVATGLRVPWSLAFMPNGGLLVTERDGRLVVVRDGVLSTAGQVPVSPDGEGGLLGLALAPDFADSGDFFVYYTASSDTGPVNRVERWHLDGSEIASADAVIIDGIPAAQFHNGGRLRIGPDDKLYVGTGDARQPELSQDTSSLAGKILRVELDGIAPNDNPFGNRVWIYGLRNTQGFDWLDDTTMVVTDHGPSGEVEGRENHDEINVARAGDNLGWPDIYACEAGEDQVSPALTFANAVPPGGAAIYRGDAIAEWTGSLLVGSLGAKHLHRVVLDGATVSRHETYLVGEPPAGAGRLRDVIMGPDGDLYVTTSNCDGRGNCPPDGDRILRLTR